MNWPSPGAAAGALGAASAVGITAANDAGKAIAAATIASFLVLMDFLPTSLLESLFRPRTQANGMVRHHFDPCAGGRPF
jgi:hypothetical protein